MFRKLIWILIVLSFIEFQPTDAFYNQPVASYPGNSLTSFNERSQPIAVVGDLQKTSIWEYLIIREKNDSERKRIVHELGEENIAGLVILGDMVFNGSDKNDWKSFDHLIEPISSKGIPILPVIGNHEYWGSNKAALKNLNKRFTRFENKHWYSIIQSDLALIFLDTNDSDLTLDEWAKQKEWFEKTLNEFDIDPSIKGIIVFTHHPPFTNSNITGDELHVQECFLPSFNKSVKTLAFISGHAHSYERFKKEGKMFIISGGGGGPRITLRSGQDCHKDLFTGASPRPFHYLLLSRNKAGVTVSVKGLNKNSSDFYLLEEFTLNYNNASFASAR